MHELLSAFPRDLSSYPEMPNASLIEILWSRLASEPINGIATLIFFLAVTHTFFASWFTALSQSIQDRLDAERSAEGLPPRPSVKAGLLHFLGEIEVVFGLWALPLLGAIVATRNWASATEYLNNTVNYTEPLFVAVIMALSSTRPVVMLAESAVRWLAGIGGRTPGAWWFVILTVSPLLGSLITEPGAMTIAALLLARKFYDLKPSTSLKYGTLGLLFVNISIGGTLTHFAAPPVVMVARAWGWDTAFMLSHFGWRAVAAVLLSTVTYYLFFRREFRVLAEGREESTLELAADESLLPIPVWITLVHLAFIAWTVVNSHYPAMFIFGFLFFVGFTKATSAHQSRLDITTPLLVGFFLAGLVIHGGLQGWWIAPVLSSLSENALFWVATVLTGFNDNALITYLATLVPGLGDGFKAAVVEGAVAGGGLTVIANAPNPAGQALLGRFFDGSISPVRLFLAALFPTLIAAALFRLI